MVHESYDRVAPRREKHEIEECLKARGRFYRQRTIKRYREIVYRYKMSPCKDCCKQYNPWVMQFDHRDPSQKKYEISWMESYGLKKLMRDIEKCDLVCANCHAERTYKNKHYIQRSSTLVEL